MMSEFNRFLADEEATVSIEYALIGIIVSVSITAVLGTIASQLNSIFSNVTAGFSK